MLNHRQKLAILRCYSATIKGLSEYLHFRYLPRMYLRNFIDTTHKAEYRSVYGNLKKENLFLLKFL